jgi:hypothetical protein
VSVKLALLLEHLLALLTHVLYHCIYHPETPKWVMSVFCSCF